MREERRIIGYHNNQNKRERKSKRKNEMLRIHLGHNDDNSNIIKKILKY